MAQESLPCPVPLLTVDSQYFLDERPERGAPDLCRVMVLVDQDIRAVLVRHKPGTAEPSRLGLIGGAGCAD